ncbi:pyridoxal phosphate-dependent transferase [Chytridium lagenaria]|nr:pyridoxal phosphate-dependent transferase [Chytridium lagenaria]
MGVRKITYCDYFASGKNLAFVEDFIRSNVMPYYANTHTETSETGSRTTHYREESRSIIKAAIGGSAALGHDREACVIFTGSGSTQAINKLIHMFGIGLRKKATIDEPPRSVCDISIGDDDPHHQPTLMDKIRNLRIKKLGTRHEVDRPDITVDTVKPVVFLSYQEHHSNILPWRHAEVDIVMINSVNGSISLDHLEYELRCYQSRPLKLTLPVNFVCKKIGTFSAGSNITGIHADTISLSILLHRYGAYAIFDFAAVGPYINVNMNPTLPENSHLAYMDAAVFSPHKMVGGPGSTGVLAVRASTLRHITGGNEQYVPHTTGGGIVDFEREEAGTPGILESIRCGLAFFVKELVGSDLIERMEQQHIDHIRRKLAQNDRIFVLGGLEDRPRAAVLSFLIVEPKHREQGKPWAYHYNFVAAVLNDFFGIQGRGGCISAISIPSAPLRTFKPGFTRVSFNYFSAEKEVEFVLDAILWIAKYAPILLPFYECDYETGAWKCKLTESQHTPPTPPPSPQLSMPSTSHPLLRIGISTTPHPSLPLPSFQECFAQADKFVAAAVSPLYASSGARLRPKAPPTMSPGTLRMREMMEGQKGVEQYRWFVAEWDPCVAQAFAMGMR